jgi:ABC-type multidrug transport system fused ATPase/permease subunit
MLFGALIDKLTSLQTAGTRPGWGDISVLLGAWVGFGLFNIGAGVFVALFADRLAHRRRLAVMANYFEHALTLPLAYHTQTHSGRVLKVMLEGTSGMWALWLSFFREHCASFVALFILLPFTLWKNWQLGLVLIFLVVLFGTLTAFVLRKTDKCRAMSRPIIPSLAERASDALGNVAVIQSFTRIEAEVRGSAQRPSPAARSADAGADLVGGGHGRDPRLGDADRARDLRRRHLAALCRG